jgi:cytochrome c peroxidase
MHVKNPAYTCASRKSNRSVLAIFGLVIFSAAALLVGLQHPTVALAKGGKGSGDDLGVSGGVSGGGNGLASLKTVAVPRPTNLARYIKDEKAAIALGKALFWDQQVGSDGQSCASCHFHAGADNRSKNQLNPGFRAVPSDTTFQLGGPNYQLKASDFPTHRLANPNDQNSAVLFDTNDIVSSQGVRNFAFTNVIVGNATDAGIAASPDPVFSVNGVNVRQVEPRNTPTMINTIFNFRSFWDGRARSEFNGVDPIGNLDPGATVLHVAAPGQAPESVSLIDGSHPELALDNASAASQAVGPPLSNLEMSYAGRTFSLLGRKMVAARALALQHVATDDSSLGSLSAMPGTGLKTGYKAMIQAAIQPEWWDSSSVIQINADGSRTILSAGAAAAQNRFSMMESNFSLIWGLAIQMYESTLVSNDSRVDQFLEGNHGALSAQEQRGMGIFTGKGQCSKCHAGAETSSASASSVQANGLVSGGSDTGFFNTGVRRINDDLGIGASIGPLNLPLSAANPAGAQGAFKTPGLRNVELTGPYMHNGGMATLEQVVDFYSRGGDFAKENAAVLSSRIKNLGLSADDKAALVAFLKALTDERVRMERAPFDHPELFVSNGSIGSTSTILADGTGNSVQDTTRIPAVGKSGLATAPPNFLQ